MDQEEEKESRLGDRETVFYIDSPRSWPHKPSGRKYAHLVCPTSLDSLHEFAQNHCELKRHWFSSRPYPHYDVPERKHILALESGATLVSTRELILLLRDSKFSKKFRGTRAASTERHKQQETDR